MNKHYIKGLLLAAFLAVPLSSMAEDIDLFVGAPAVSADRPNVLLIIDNTGNWNTAFNNEKAALKALFDGLPEDKFNVGVMMYGSPDSGYVRAGIRPMDAINRPLYSDFVNGLEQVGDRQSARTMGRTMSEAHRYLSGLQSVGGASFEKRDHTGNTSGNATSNAIYARPGNALSSSSATTYTSPLAGTSCAKTFIIYIGNTLPSGNVTQDNTARNNAAKSELISAGGEAAATEIPLSPSGFQGNVSDEWARFLNQSMGVVTYTVDVDPTDPVTGHNNGKANSALLKSMAKVGGGKYFAVDSSVGGGSEIAAALNTIFSEIQSVNSVFASVSLPVSVNTQGTFLNQVYIGMFRPDASSLPRWAGNLKQYKLGFVDNTLRLLDAADASAINSQTGFITECARSFWTPSLVDNYWSFNPQGACLATANSATSNSPDGNIVEKGAQAYLLRSTASRTVKTCDPAFAACTSLTDFNTSNAAITAASLGAADATERNQLINWARGLDIDDERASVYGETPNASTATQMRPSAHGDVVHSRPVALNYGTDAAPQVVVFYGGNDGVLRAINGNRSAAIGGAAAGSELWSFMPPEFYTTLKRLRANSPEISFPGSTTAGAVPKAYGFDGPVTAYSNAANDVHWLYAAMRRGGRVFYAFDVSTPATPALKWKLGCPNKANDVGCSPGFDGIGQTWSSPKIMSAAGHAGPLLIMGGGYDPCEDADPHTCNSSSKGNKVYVLNASTGALLKTFDTDRGVIADITVVPGSNGLAAYAYAADLGGNVYRISGVDANTPIASTAPGDWTMTKIAALGCDTGEAFCNRKFMFAPDVVVDGNTNTLLLGSGDREKPLGFYSNAASVANYFFMLKDQPTTATWLSSESVNCGANVICRASLEFIAAGAASPAQAVVDAKKGWYLGLAPSEQVVTSAITVFGVVTFSTHSPAVATPGQCSNLGTARVYNTEFGNAESASGGLRFENISGGGLPPSPVAGMVTLDDGTTVPFIIGASGASPLEGGEPPTPPSAAQPKAKVYWNIEQ